MRNGIKIFIIMTVLCLLAGCGGGESVPERNTVSIQKDGTIRQTIVEQFEPEYYDIEELNIMAQEKIARLGSTNEAIVCESMKADGGQIVVEMTYQTDTDYRNFNNRDIFNGTVSEAAAQGYTFQNLVGTDGAAVGAEVVASAGEDRVVIIQTKAGEALDVSVYGKIVYASDNIALSGQKNAAISAGEEDMVSCVVFQ